MKMKLLVSALCMLAIWQSATAQQNLIPQPRVMKIVSEKRVKPTRIDSRIDTTLAMNDEGYTLRIDSRRIEIRAKSRRGEIWAHRTLEQLRDQDGRYVQLEIEDSPAFPIRGFMHDTGRNFIEVDMLKKHIDLMSRYKLNTFQWHLTDNPAWRIECLVYPELNDARFQRKGRDAGRFYTYDQIRDVIRYAGERGVEVIPEIDMPGHSVFFKTTFGFSMDSPEGREVLERCLAEFFDQIPRELCPRFHIGSDEVHINDPRGFMAWAEGVVAKHGRQAMAWDPGLPSANTTIRQIWNEAEGANTASTTKEGSYVDSFMGYLNLYDPMVFTRSLFLHTPCLVEQSDSRALGGILCLWNDVRVTNKENIPLHNGMLNGMLPFAERFWTGGRVARLASTHVMPEPQSQAGRALQAFERRMIAHRDGLLEAEEMRWVASSDIPWSVSVVDTVIHAWGGAVEMDALCKGEGLSIDTTSNAWARTRIYAQRDTVIRVWVGFEAPTRSNRISGGIGEQGKWENQGLVKVNGVALDPPIWEQPGLFKYHFHTWHKPQEELAYTNEQLYWMREPISVPLVRGWNDVELYIPKTFAGQRWNFAFIPLTERAHGRVSEATGLKFEM